MKDEIEKIVVPVIERHDCFLWGVEILRGRKRPTLRIYIESDQGANIDDCENISKDLNYEIDLDSSFGDDYVLDPPFFVLATQNPLEQEGTYALPEAQLDRFMFKIHVDYPSFDEEIEIMESVTSGVTNAMKSVLKKAEIIALQDVVSRIHVTPHLFQYVATLVRNTRPDGDNSIDVVKNYVSWGCGPRACLNLITGAKARAALHGNMNVSLDDIKALAKPVLRHRMGLNFLAQSDGETTDSVIEQLLEVTPEGEELHGAA